MKHSLILLLALLAALAAGAAPVAAKKNKPKRTFLYVFNSPNIRSWELVSGQLEPTNPPFFASGVAAFLATGDHRAMVYEAKFKLLVLAGNGGVETVSVGKDGLLKDFSGAVGGSYLGAALHRKGDKAFVYLSMPFSNEIDAYKLSKKGKLTHLDGFPVGTVAEPGGMAVKDGVLFVAGKTGSLAAYSIGKKGDLEEVAGSPFGDLGSPAAVWADSAANAVYMPDQSGAGIFGLRVKNGQLEELDGSPFEVAGDFGVLGLALGPNGIHYATGAGGGMSAMVRDGVGALQALGPRQENLVSAADCAAQSPDGAFLAVTHGSSDRLYLYSIDPKTGLLTEVDEETPPLDNNTPKSAIFVQL